MACALLSSMDTNSCCAFVPLQPPHTHASRLEWICLSGKFTVTNPATGDAGTVTAVRCVQSCRVTTHPPRAFLTPPRFPLSLARTAQRLLGVCLRREARANTHAAFIRNPRAPTGCARPVLRTPSRAKRMAALWWRWEASPTSSRSPAKHFGSQRARCALAGCTARGRSLPKSGVRDGVAQFSVESVAWHSGPGGCLAPSPNG